MVFIAARALSLVPSGLWCTGFTNWQHVGSGVLEHGLSTPCHVASSQTRD